MLQHYGAQERVIVDLGSERSSDMTYTLGADIYVGDVSSQIYEFVYRPRPCLFLNATGSDHSADPDFRFWTFGDVIDDPGDILPAIRRAREHHSIYVPAQIQAVEHAFGPRDTDAAANAAAIIGTILRDKRRADVAERA
jgi:CDP-glycerol glycerophosphotransferase (TagB/SpsB family)